MNTYYLKEDHTYEPCDLYKWGRQIEEMRANDTKHVAADEIDGKRISTVWLGMDHNIDGESPLLFETMVFEGNDYREIYCDRYTTWEEAEVGHKKAVKWVKDGCEE